MKCYWINVVDRTVTEAEYDTLADMRRLVGGHIELAHLWRDTGDVLYVDEEYLMKGRPAGWFRVAGFDYPFGSNGVVVGREIGDDIKTADPSVTLAMLQASVSFPSQESIEAWARANSSEPYVTIRDLDGGPAEVLARTGEMFGVAPKKEE